VNRSLTVALATLIIKSSAKSMMVEPLRAITLVVREFAGVTHTRSPLAGVAGRVMVVSAALVKVT